MNKVTAFFIEKKKIIFWLFIIVMSFGYLICVNDNLYYNGDSATYLIMAKDYLENTNYAFLHHRNPSVPILFPCIIAFLSYCFGYDINILKVIFICLSIFNVVLFYFIFKKYDKNFMFLIPFAVISNPYFLFFSNQLLTGSLYLFFCTMIFLLFLNKDMSKTVFQYTSYIFFSIIAAYFSRTVGISLIMAYSLLVLDKIFIRKNKNYKWDIFFISIFLLILLIKTLNQQGLYTNFLICTDNQMFFSKMITNIWVYIKIIPTSMFQFYIWIYNYIPKENNYILYYGISNFIIVICPIILGLFYKFKENRTFIEYYFCCYFAILFSVGFCEMRYLMPVLPFLFYYYFKGVKKTIDFLFQSKLSTIIFKIFIIMFIFGNLIGCFRIIYKIKKDILLKDFEEEWIDYKKACNWLSQYMANETAVILCRKASFAHLWTNQPTIFFVKSKCEQSNIFKKYNIKYIIFDQFKNYSEKEYRENFIKKNKKNLREIKRFNDTIVYEYIKNIQSSFG